MSLPVVVVEIAEAILIRVYLALGECEQALDLLDKLQARAEAGGRFGHLIEMHLLRSLALQKQNQGQAPAAAIQSLGQALALTEPEGYVLFAERGLAALRKGGTLVEYPAPTADICALVAGIAKLAWQRAVLRNGKSVKSYGASALYHVDKRPFMEELPVLFKLLEEGRIKPIIADRYSLLEAAKANELLESGQVSGNIVLLAPQLL